MDTKDAIERFGSVKAIADALSISVQAVYAWGDHVPELRAYQIREILESLAAEAPLPGEHKEAA